MENQVHSLLIREKYFRLCMKYILSLFLFFIFPQGLSISQHENSKYEKGGLFNIISGSTGNKLNNGWDRFHFGEIENFDNQYELRKPVRKGASKKIMLNGVNGNVCVLAEDNNGNIYIGGNFTQAGGIAANHIAKWDGISWSSLGNGVNGLVVFAIAISGNDVYVGGDFTTAGEISANRIAKWDGSNWSALGTGFNTQYVRTIAIKGNDLYAGGFFTQAGGIQVNNIAKWDGTSWSALGSGTDYVVNALTIKGNDVYIGGQFSTAGGVLANNIAKWDGSSWSALGEGVNESVYFLTTIGSDIYIGGPFTTAGGNPAKYIVKWDGNLWTAFGAGLNSTVIGIAKNKNILYACGYFTEAGGNSANHIAKWDGSVWSPLGEGVNEAVLSLLFNKHNTLIIGGSFTASGDKLLNYLAKWDGTNWLNLEEIPPVLVNVTLQFSGNIQYYDNGWKTFVKPSMSLPAGTYHFKFDGYEKVLNISGKEVVKSIAIIKLLNSNNSGIPNGTVQLFNLAWVNLGSTGSDGAIVCVIDGLKRNVAISMNYEYGHQEKWQDIKQNSTVIFQTKNVILQLQNHIGNIITSSGDKVQYYSGNWHDLGITKNGTVNKELLPLIYCFSMEYEHARLEKWQNLSVSDKPVVFQTALINVQLKNFISGYLANGIVWYYSGNW
jgi:hypothetical protein